MFRFECAMLYALSQWVDLGIALNDSSYQFGLLGGAARGKFNRTSIENYSILS